jgi:hypothetical protein
MINRISETEDILARLVGEGKRKVINTTDYSQATAKLNKEMEAVRRDYKQKDSDSQKSASHVILTS